MMDAKTEAILRHGTPEELEDLIVERMVQKAQEIIEAEDRKFEQEVLYGNGSSEPLGVLVISSSDCKPIRRGVAW